MFHSVILVQQVTLQCAGALFLCNPSLFEIYSLHLCLSVSTSNVPHSLLLYIGGISFS